MKREMESHRLFFALMLALGAAIASGRAGADEIAEVVPLSGHALRQFIAVVEGANIDLARAELEKSEESARVSAELPVSRPEALVSAVLFMAEGEVRSSPLRNAEGDELGRESGELAQGRIEDMKSEIVESRRRIAALELEIESANTDLRHKAGLTEVAAIYTKVRQHRQAVLNAEKAINLIETFRSALTH